MRSGDNKTNSPIVQLINTDKTGMHLMLDTDEEWDKTLQAIFNQENNPLNIPARHIPANGHLQTKTSYHSGLIFDAGKCNIRNEYIEVTPEAIAGIILYSTDDFKTAGELYHERYHAIKHKLNVSEKLGIILPIVIANPETGITEYTIKQQNSDIVDYLSTHPEAPNREELSALFTRNSRYENVGQAIRKDDFTPKTTQDWELLIERKIFLLKERNYITRQLAAMTYEDALYKVTDDFHRHKNELQDTLSKIESDLAYIEQYWQEGTANEPALFNKAFAPCLFELKVYEYLQNNPPPDIQRIQHDILNGSASEEDIIWLNSVDMEFVDKAPALESIAKLKALYIKNKILTEAYPDEVESSFCGKKIMTTPPMRAMLKAIEHAEKSRKPDCWRNCMNIILKEANQAGHQPFNFFSKSPPEIKVLNQEHEILYSFIIETLALEPRDRLNRMNGKIQKEVVLEEARHNRSVDSVVAMIVDALSYLDDAKIRRGCVKDILGIIDNIKALNTQIKSHNPVTDEQARTMKDDLEKLLRNTHNPRFNRDFRNELEQLLNDLTDVLGKSRKLKI